MLTMATQCMAAMSNVQAAAAQANEAMDAGMFAMQVIAAEAFWLASDLYDQVAVRLKKNYKKFKYLRNIFSNVYHRIVQICSG